MDQENNQELESPLIPAPKNNVSFEKSSGLVFAEVQKLLKLALPMVVAALLAVPLQLISVMFIGHLGQLVLSGASMGSSFISVTSCSIMIGLLGALATLCGQSYGAKEFSMLGIHMQRAMLVVLLVSVPLAIISAKTSTILVFLGQDVEIATEAGKYAQFLIPSIFGVAFFQCQVQFLQAQNNVIPVMITSGVTTLIHIIICWFLVFKTDLGSRGAALAISISSWINAFLLMLYISISPSCKMTWTGFSREAFHDISKFLKLGVPSAVMICLQIWLLEFLILLSGLLPNPQLETSVLSISLGISGLILMLPAGLSCAVSTRVSNELGAGRPYEARLAAVTSILMVLTEGIVVSIALILTRKLLGYCFSSEEEVVTYVSQMILLIAASHIQQGLQVVLTGIVTGCGWQTIGAFINLGANYMLGIPSVILLAFVFRIGGKGFLMGMFIAVSAQALLLAIVTFRTSWEKEANKAAERVQGTVTVLPIEDP